MSSISGNVESKSRAGTGIKVEGKWYNGDTKLLADVAWKDNVTFEVDGKDVITSISKAKGTDAPTNAPVGNTFDKRQEVIIFQSARNAAQVLVKDLLECGALSLPGKKCDMYDSYMALISDHTVKFHNAAVAVYTGTDAEEVA